MSKNLILICSYLFLIVPCQARAIIVKGPGGDFDNTLAEAVIVDHNCADLSAIPDNYIAGAASLRALMRHASVGQGIDWGLNCLAGNHPTKQDCSGFVAGTYDRSNWVLELRGGNWQAKVDDLVSQVALRADDFDVFTTKLCYIDALGDNHPDWEYFRSRMEQLETDYPDKKFVWWTIPLTRDGQPGTDVFNALMRSYCTANNKILFDIADIECHDPDGTKLTNAAGDEVISQNYTKEIHAGHLNIPGRIRVASALWHLMARLAGWQKAYHTIQAAIDDANDGDTIIVQPGTYTGPGNGDIDFHAKAITVRSTDPNDPDIVAATVIDGRWGPPYCHHGFIFRSGEGRDSVVEGLTIAEFSAAAELFSGDWYTAGGGVFCRGSSPTVSRCVIKSNSTPLDVTELTFGGGGIWCDQGSSPRIVHCTFIDNYGNLMGGAIHCDDGNAIVEHCTITQNWSDWDCGGITNYGGSITITNCTISNNYGGGISCGGNALVSHCVISGNRDEGGVLATGNATISYCTIAGNCARPCGMMRALRGGGIYCKDNVIVSHCLIAGNWSNLCPADEIGPEYEGNGGGIYCESGNPTITSCTITNNSADDNGGGIYSTGNLAITNCIVWSNASPNEPQISGEPTVSYSDIEGGSPGTGNIDVDPCFARAGYWAAKNDPNIALEPGDPNAAWSNGDYHLKSQAGRWDPTTADWTQDDVTSPCIDAGSMSSPIGLELFPNGGIINIGAYGSTDEASKSYFGKPICETIVAGDINGDCKVDFADFRLMALHWLEDNRQEAGLPQ